MDNGKEGTNIDLSFSILLTTLVTPSYTGVHGLEAKRKSTTQIYIDIAGGRTIGCSFLQSEIAGKVQILSIKISKQNCKNIDTK